MEIIIVMLPAAIIITMHLSFTINIVFIADIHNAVFASFLVNIRKCYGQ